MTTNLLVTLLLAFLFAGVCSKFIGMVDQGEPDVHYDATEEDRKVCFCCRAFVCRHQLCPCSRFTALF
uniref:Uncharacterized protein n=1 Tax=Caenorhabditis japonica TaxID=281687 RepID=A0A8R1EMT6_CAEJA